jgi:DNA repair protein RadC
MPRHVTTGEGAHDLAGYQTVAQVLDAPAYQLTAVQGIGPHTAEQVRLAAQRAAQQVAKDTKLRLDIDRRHRLGGSASDV